MVAIISRSAWGARAPRGRTTVPLSARVEVTLHYSTGPISQTPRQIQNFHMDGRGWVDIGYNFLVDHTGRAYEGRGWNVQGAHAAPRNRQGIGVCYIGSDGMTDAAKRTVIALYDEANRRTGRTLARRGHRDINATSCPGNGNYAWWRSANFRDVAGGPPPIDDALEDDMPKHRRYEGRTEVELPPGSWRSVLFDSVADSVHGDKDDGGLYSLVGVYEKDGAFYDVSCGVTLQGLEPGCEVQLRATEYEDNGSGWEVVRDRPIHSPAHVGGGGHFTYAWKGNLASGRRVRVRVVQFGDTTARLTSATSDVFYWPR